MVQRRAARFVTADYRRRRSVTVLLNQLQWQEACTHSKVTMLYCIHHQLVAIPPGPPYITPTVAIICSCNNTTAASTHTSTPSSLVSSTCGTNCHQTQWGLLRSLNSRTDLPPPCCIKSYYGPCFISTSPCTVFTSFTNVLYVYMNFISAHLLRIFYSWSKHKRICTVRQYSGSLAHPRGMY